MHTTGKRKLLNTMGATSKGWKANVWTLPKRTKRKNISEMVKIRAKYEQRKHGVSQMALLSGFTCGNGLSQRAE